MRLDRYEDDDHDGDYPPKTWDTAGLHVMREQCSTCIFRPGNLMDLRPGRLRDLTDDTDGHDANVICHQTLDRNVGALCAGSVERRPGQMVRIAGRLDGIVYEEPVAK